MGPGPDSSCARPDGMSREGVSGDVYRPECNGSCVGAVSEGAIGKIAHEPNVMLLQYSLK